MKILLAFLLTASGLTWARVPPGAAADFTGDGKDNLAVFRPTSGLWAVRGVTRFYFGGAGDIPAPGDYAGGPAAEAAVFRPSTGLWAVRGTTRVYYGKQGDLPQGASGGDHWTSDGSRIYYAAGNVGIGVADPDFPLQVDYAIKVGDAGSSSPFIYLENSAGGVDALGLYSAVKELYLGANNTKLSLRTSGWPRLTIDSSGRVGIGTQTPSAKFAVLGLTGTSSYNPVRVNTATGDFYYESSSERRKREITNLETDFGRILAARPKSYRDAVSGEREIGYLAEDFAALGLDPLVIRDGEGRPDGLKYERITLYLVELLRRQRQTIADLEERIARIEGR